MQLTAMVLTMFAALAISAVAAGDDAPKAAPVLTPAQVRARAEDLRWGELITVAFRVGDVDTMTTTYPDGSSHEVVRLHPASSGFSITEVPFHVALSPEVEGTLKRVGIANLEQHFAGKSVTVRGRLGACTIDLIGSETIFAYHSITVHDLDQFLAVSEGEASPGE